MSKILNYGSLNIDYVYDVPHILQGGETLSSTDRNIFAGGKGLNQSVAMARAGGNVSHFGAVGKDDSKILTDIMQESNISLEFLKKRDTCSGHTVIQVDANAQNCILLFGGANRTLTHEEMDEVLSHFEKGDFLVMQNETNDIEYMLRKASSLGIKPCLNVSPISDDILKLPLELCYLLIVNEIEAAALANLPQDSDPYELLKGLEDKYPTSSFVLTLGSRGSILKMKGDKAISCKAFKVKAVDTTAAGDTFLGYLVSGLSQGKDYAEILQTATAASALAVQTKGAAPSIPLMADVQAFLAKQNTCLIVDKI